MNNYNLSVNINGEGIAPSPTSSKFAHMSLCELLSLYEYLSMAVQQNIMMQNSPAFGDNERFNAAGEYLEQLYNHIDTERHAVIDAVKVYKPKNDGERHIKGHILLRYEAEFQELDMTEMATLALSNSKPTH